MRIYLRTTFAAITLFLLGFKMANAQDSLKVKEQSEKPDTVITAVQKLQSDIKILQKLKITGYVQAQYQIVDSAGVASFAGGNFGTGINNRFMIRRGRVKLTYNGGNFSKYVMEFDISEKGLAIKDMYAKFYDPWIQTFALTAGVFNRPFGYEIGVSSSVRESPERVRYSQTLFPLEREVGAQLTIQGSEESNWNFLKINLGMFNGNGPTPETDNKKDFIGHIGINKSNKNKSFKYGFGGSYYKGGVLQSTDNIYSISDNNGVPQFTAASISSAGSYKGKFANREYVGADAQLTVSTKMGSTSLTGEYIQGDQPGTASSSTSPLAITSGDTYLRKFNGGYLNFVQDFKGVPFSVIAKYDWYDPNTKVAGETINVANKFSAADITYRTLGLGLLYQYDHNIRLTGYYDIVNNETSANLPGFTNDLKDNVLTMRIQYKF